MAITFVLFLCILSGCVSQISPERPLTVSPISTRTDAAVVTTFLVSTPTPTPAPKPTPTHIPLLTSMPIHWLENTQECQLPCWWGMTPGKTTIQQAREIMLTYTGQKGDIPKDKVNHYTEYQYGIRIGDTPFLIALIYLYEKDGLLEGIKIYSEDYQDRDLFWKEWHDFRSVNFLITYGEPSNGQVLLFWERPSPTTHEVLYRMLFEYNVRGIMVEYGGLTENIDNLYTICPDTNTEPFFQMFLSNPEKVVFISPFEKLSSLPFSESSSVTLKDYFRQVISNPEDSCFTNPQSKWDDR